MDFLSIYINKPIFFLQFFSNKLFLYGVVDYCYTTSHLAYRLDYRVWYRTCLF